MLAASALKGKTTLFTATRREGNPYPPKKKEFFKDSPSAQHHAPLLRTPVHHRRISGRSGRHGREAGADVPA